MLLGTIAGGTADYEIVATENMRRKPVATLRGYSAGELDRLPWNEKRRYKVILNRVVNEKELKRIAEQIVAKVSSDDPDIDEIILWFYSDKGAVDDGPWDVAQAIWAPGGRLGNITADIAKRNDRGAYSLSLEKSAWTKQAGIQPYLEKHRRKEVKGGRSENERRTIWQRIVKAEDRALCEVRAISGNRYSYDLDKLKKLETKYAQEVMLEFGITNQEQQALSVEAFEENWALPPVPPCAE
jgi:hypothetical protein